MLEARTIIDQVQQHDYSPNWRVYRGCSRWSKAILSIIGYWLNFFAGICILFMIAVIILSFSTSKITGNGFTILILYSTIFTLFAGMIIIVVYILRKAWIAADTMLVILPDRVFFCLEGKLEKTRAFNFIDIKRINIGKSTIVGLFGRRCAFSRATTDYWLDLYTCDGHYLKWPLDKALGELDIVGNDIIAAHAHYWYQL